MVFEFARKNRNKLALLSLLILILFFAQVFTNRSTLTIINDSEEKTVYVKGAGQEENLFEFRMTPNEKKKIRLAPGSYRVGASAHEKLSLYQRDLKRLKTNEILLKTEAQKDTKKIGQNDNNCAKESEGDFVFYGCDYYQGVFGVNKNGEEVSVSSTLADRIFGDVHSAQQEQSQEGSALLKDYPGGWLELGSRDNKLFFRALAGLSSNTESNQTSEYSGYSGYLTQKLVGANPKSKKFLVLDKKEGALLVFESHADTSPFSIDISKELGGDSDHISKSVFISGDYGYVVVSRDSAELDNHHEEGEALDDADDIDPKIITVDLRDSSKQDVYDLPDKYIPSLVVADPSGKGVLLLPLYQNEQPAIFADSEKAEKIILPSDEIKETCWSQEGSIYYTTPGKGQIFRYSIGEQAAFLLYNNPRDSVSNLSCSGGSVGFTLGSDNDGVVTGFVHYELSDNPYKGPRLESLLPIYLDVGRDVIKLSAETNGYVVSLLSDGDANGGPDKTEAQKVLDEKLSELSIEKGSINFIFAY